MTLCDDKLYEYDCLYLNVSKLKAPDVSFFVIKLFIFIS